MRRRKLIDNRKAISMMQDAVLFMVMVSISGAILLPAMTSQIPKEGLIEQHKESVVNEALLMLMTSRTDYVKYNFANQIYELEINGNKIFKNEIFEPLLMPITSKELLHKTYADLCVESVSCQLNVFDNRINILTEDLDGKVKTEVEEVLNQYLGNKYDFHLVVKWWPIIGLPFGGDLDVGNMPPENIDSFVATSYVTISDTMFTDIFNGIETYIRNEIEISSTQIEVIQTEMKDYTSSLVKKAAVICIENITDKLINGLLDSVLGSITGSLDGFCGGSFSTIFQSQIFSLISDNMGETINPNNLVSSVSDMIVNSGSDTISNIFNDSIDNLDFSQIEDLTDQQEVDQFVEDFFLSKFRVLQAEFTLTIWEV
jgi:hypothetical protein